MITIKKSFLIAALITSFTFSFADYIAKIPLEVAKGGLLPDNSIIIGNVGTTTPTTPEKDNCHYDFNDGEGSFVSVEDSGTYYSYNSNLIGYSTEDGVNVPAGLSAGILMLTTEYGKLYEICGNNLGSYPSLPPPGFSSIPTDPQEQACLSKRSQADAIAANYGTTVSSLYYISGNCNADVGYPSGGWDGIVHDFNEIGINIAM